MRGEQSSWALGPPSFGKATERKKKEKKGTASPTPRLETCQVQPRRRLFGIAQTAPNLGLVRHGLKHQARCGCIPDICSSLVFILEIVFPWFLIPRCFYTQLISPSVYPYTYAFARPARCCVYPYASWELPGTPKIYYTEGIDVRRLKSPERGFCGSTTLMW